MNQEFHPLTRTEVAQSTNPILSFDRPERGICCDKRLLARENFEPTLNGVIQSDVHRQFLYATDSTDFSSAASSNNLFLWTITVVFMLFLMQKIFYLPFLKK